MKAVPLPLLMLAEVELVKANVTLPSRTLQGVAGAQEVAISKLVDELRLAVRSASWLAFCTEDPPPPLLSMVQPLVAAQP